MSPSPEPVATVYVPTLNGGPSLARCLASIEAQTVSVTVVVADNGAGNGCRQMLENDFPEVLRVAFGENLGFGTAVNRAVAAEGDGPIVLVNDDAVTDPRFVESLLEAWDGGRSAMVAGVLTAAGGNIDSAGVVADETLLGSDYLNGEDTAALETAADPLGPTGGGALYDRDAFESVGGFDENIFLYYEDLDLALRIRATGGTCRLAPAARATHEYSATLGAGSPDKYRFTGWSRGYLLGRYRILRRPRNLANVAVVEGAVCLAQLVTARSTAGLVGRVRGWNAGRKLPGRHPEAAALEPSDLIGSLKAKLRRRAQ